jgi:uncharacterized UPF0160 family protein
MLRVATHNGSFHADEVFAVAALRQLGAVEVLRTRDEQLMADCDVRVDVGLGNDPATGDFDHHQQGGAGQRENGIRYASFGLVWKHYGETICRSASAAAQVDAKLVQIVDGHDNGQTLFSSEYEGLRPSTVDHVITLLNPVWDEQPTPEDYEAAFGEAVALAETILLREVARACAQEKASHTVRGAIEQADDPRLLQLDCFMPWREVVVAEAPEAQFIVFPRQDGWALQAVPVKLDSFENRRDLPAAWAGKSGRELAVVSGVPDAVFCHTGRFFAAASSLAGAQALAALALASS